VPALDRAVSNTGALDAASYAGIFRGLINILHSFKRLAHTANAFPHDLTGREGVTRIQNISDANVHPSTPTFSASKSMTPSIANCAWLLPNPRMAPLVGLFVNTALDSTSTFGTRYGPQEWQQRGAGICLQCRIASRVANNAGSHSQQVPLGIGADFIFQNHRMALDVMLRRLLARENYFYWTLQQESSDCRLALNGEFFLGSECATACRQFDFHFFPAGASKCQKSVSGQR